MRLSEYLLNVSEEIKKHCLSLKFPEDDVRRDFHGVVYDLVYNYYRGHVSFELSEAIVEGRVMFKEDMYQHKIHIDRITEINTIPMLTSSYMGSLNNQLLIGVWTAFELSVTVIADAILSDADKEDLLSFKKDDFMKILKRYAIDAETKERINKKLLESHLSHVPLWRKFKKIIRRAEGKYDGDINVDIAFLKFYSTMRNTVVHSNCIYYGIDFDYRFERYHFVFRNGQIFKYTEDKELRPRLYITLISQLANIYMALTDLLNEVPEIKYPDTGVYWDE